MLDDLLNYLQKRREQRLYRQWAIHEGLQKGIPATMKEEKSQGSLYEQWVQEGSLSPDDVPVEDTGEPEKHRLLPGDQNMSRMLLRYLLYAVAAGTVLLVAVAILSTILIMKSC